MGRNPADPIRSCHECIGMLICYRSVLKPDRMEARRFAERCRLPYKGRAAETLRVAGAERGISRRKAVRMHLAGQVRWLDGRTVSLLEPAAALAGVRRNA